MKDKRKKFKKIVGKGVSKVKVVAGAQVEKAVNRVKHGKEEGKKKQFVQCNFALGLLLIQVRNMQSRNYINEFVIEVV